MHTISLTTYSTDGKCYYLSFTYDGTDSLLCIKFLPRDPTSIFSADKLDVNSMRMRDLETLLSLFGEYGLTLITRNDIDIY